MPECHILTDDTGKELSKHGTRLFPLASYIDDPVIDPVAWHWHEEFEVGIITEGSVLIEAPNKKIDMQAGDGFFIGSEVLHSAVHGAITPCKLHSIVFQHSIVSGSRDSAFYQQYVKPIMTNSAYHFIHLHHDLHASELKHIQNAWHIDHEKQPGFEIRVRNELSELFFALINLSLCNNEMSTSEKKEVFRLKHMLSYIELHYAESISLSMLAHCANISDSEVLRVFRKVMNTTPVKYLTQYRIQQATSFLTQTDLQISEICSLCGFQDISYFTKVFREIKGMPPAKFRKSLS